MKKSLTRYDRKRLHSAASAVLVCVSLTTAAFAADLQKTNRVSTSRSRAQFVIPTETAAHAKAKQAIPSYVPPRSPGFNEDIGS